MSDLFDILDLHILKGRMLMVIYNDNKLNI